MYIFLLLLLVYNVIVGGNSDQFKVNKETAINLQNKAYKRFPDTDVFSCDKLTTLDLSYNEIEALERDDFQNCKDLKTLYLNHNRLTTLKKDVFSLLSLDTISLHNNPFQCDCSLLWLAEYFKTVNVIKDVYCSHLATSKSYRIIDLSYILDECLLQLYGEGSKQHGLVTSSNRQRRNVGIVQFHPLPKDGCSLKVLLNTLVTFTVNSLPGTVELMIDGLVVYSGQSSIPFTHTYATVGKYKTRIDLDSSKVWEEDVDVIHIPDLQIIFQPQHGYTYNIATNVNTTFSLKSVTVSDLTCVLMDFNWTINDEPISGDTYEFPTVGSSTKSVEVGVSNPVVSATKIYLQKYDIVTDLNVVILSYDSCSGDKIRFFINATGTVIHYFYRVPVLSNDWKELSGDGSEHEELLNLTENFSINFKAENVISTQEISKTFIYTGAEPTVVLNPKNVYVNEEALMKPEVFVTCESYEYTWQVNGIALRNGQSPDIPLLNHTFYAEATYTVELIVNFTNFGIKTYQSQVVVVSPVIFELQMKNNSHTNQLYTVLSTVDSPENFQYRWILSNNPTTWQNGESSNPPVYDHTFTIEGIYELVLEINNGVDYINKSVNVKVQNPIINLSADQDVFHVELNTAYIVRLTHAYSSIFDYSISVTDEKGTVNEKPSTRNSFYQWSHLARHTQNVIYFMISDNLNTATVNVSIFAMNKISYIDATLSRNIISIGDFIEGNVVSTPENIGDVNYTWYLQLPEHRETLGESAHLSSTQFNTAGIFIIQLVASNEISNATTFMNLTVDFMYLQFIANHTADRNISAPNQFALTPGVSVYFHVHASLYSSTQNQSMFVYKWYLNSAIQTKFTANTFFYTATLQGQFELSVHVSYRGISNVSSFTVYVQKKLTHVRLESLITNGTFINASSTSFLQYSFVYVEPTDVIDVTGTISCSDKNGIEFSRISYPQNVYQVNITGLSGLVTCNVTLTNLVSSVTTFYQYLVGTFPKLLFIEPTKVAATGSPVTLKMDVLNIPDHLSSRILWYLDEMLVSCTVEIDSHSTPRLQCPMTFHNHGVSIVKVVLKSPYLETHHITTVTVYDPISNVDISRRWVRMETPSNISVTADGDGEMLYEWKGYTSTQNYVTVEYPEKGQYNLSVNVSNPASYMLKTFIINVYEIGQFWIGASRSVIFNGTHRVSYIPMGTSQRFTVHNGNPTSTYDWEIKAIQSKTNLDWFFPNRIHLDYYFSNRYTSYVIRCIEKPPNGDPYSKEVFALIYEPVSELTHNFGDKIAIAGEPGTLIISWDGTGPQWVNTLNVSNVKSHNYIINIEKQQITLNFVTDFATRNFSVEVLICGRVNCMRKVWTFKVKINSQDVQLKISGGDVGFRANTTNTIDIPGNSTVAIQVPQRMKLINATKQLLDENGTVVQEGFVTLEGGMIKFDIHVPPGQYTLILFIKLGEGVTDPFFYTINIFFADCNAPTTEYRKLRTHVKSQWFYSELNITSNCLDFKHFWSFERLEEDSCLNQALDANVYNPNTLQGMTLVLNKPVLEVPPRGFDVGVYCVRHLLKYGGSGVQIFTIELTVIGTPLVPAIDGGAYRVIGNKQSISINAGTTMDPDMDSNNKSHLLFKWDISHDIHCFVSNDAAVNISEWSHGNIVMNIITDCLTPLDRAYDVLVKVRRKQENEVEETSQKLDVVDGVAPLIKIECVTCSAYKSYKYLRGKKLKLLASCSNCGNLELEYKWQVRGSESESNIVLTPENQLSPQTSAALVLEKYTLDGNQTYNISCEADVKGMDAHGTTILTLPVNPSPENGTCILSPPTGISMVDTFTFTCSEWDDLDNENQPFIYWLWVGHTDSVSNMSILYRGIKSSVPLYLPLGYHVDNKLYFQVWVQDSLGAYTIANSSYVIVTSSEEAEDNPVQFVVDAVLPYLQQGTANKDLNDITTGIIAAVSFIGQDSTTENTNKTIVVDQLVSSASQVETSSVDSLAQVVNAMAKIYQSSNDTSISETSHNITLSSVQGMLSTADIFSTVGISLEDETFNEFANVISKNLKYYSNTDVTKRKRRAVAENTTDPVDKSYRLIQKVYEVILKTTVTGERDQLIQTDLFSTSLSRKTGEKMTIGRYAGACYTSANTSYVSSLKDVSSVLECSSLNPFSKSDQRNIASTTYFTADFVEIPVKNLPESENVIIAVPNTLTEQATNASYVLLPNSLYSAVLTNFSYLEDIEHAGIHMVIDVTSRHTQDTLIDVFISKDVALTFDNTKQANFSFTHDSLEIERTVFLSGSTYNTSSKYYYGIRHNSPTPLNITLTTYISRCVFWDVGNNIWESFGCRSMLNTTRNEVFCNCNHLTSFSSTLNIEPNPLDFTVLTEKGTSQDVDVKNQENATNMQLRNICDDPQENGAFQDVDVKFQELDIEENPVALAACLTILVLYLIIGFLAWRRDRNSVGEDMRIPFIGSKDGFYQYEIRIKTGMYPWSGTSAKVGIQIFGTGCTTKVRVVKTHDSFKRNAVDIFRISLDRSIGKIHKVRVWHDNSGSDPSWYLERIVIRSLVNGEKFFFFCNRWIGTDCDDGQLEHDFHVADIHEMKKFSTIFYDVIGRGFNDYHLWLSVFERPRFSRFTRLQRITCLFTFVLSWMCINAMWFDVAPEGKVDLYIGFRGYSFEEVFIGLITAVIVLPINLFIVFLFRKSKQRYVSEWEKARFKTLTSKFSPASARRAVDAAQRICDVPQEKGTSQDVDVKNQAPLKKLRIWKALKHEKKEPVEVDMIQLLDDRDDSSNDFNYGLNCSPLRRKNKCLNIHDLVDQEENSQEFSNMEVTASTDRLVLRTSNLTSDNNDGEEKSSPPLTLPHSFASNSLLTMSPQHQCRVSSAKLPRRNSTGQDHLVQLTLQRSRSLESLGIQSADEQSRLMKSRLDPDELREHMTDIVEQQLSSIVNDLQSEKKHELALPSDYSSSIFHHEAITASLIKKNEMLADRLEIPDIVELDPCTRWHLPYWFKYVAYVLCFLISGMSVVIILTYGQQFGYDASIKWLTVLFVEILEDFFLAYPILLLLVAFILALMVKPLDLDQVDHTDFYECGDGHVLQCDKTASNQPVQPPSGYALELLQREGIRRKRFRKFVKDLVYQALLMWFVIGICSAKYSSYVYPKTKMVDKELKEPLSYTSLHSINHYWSWLETTYLPYVLSTKKKDWVLASQPTIRQSRTSIGACQSERYSKMADIQRCAKGPFLTGMKFEKNWSIPTGWSTGNEDFTDVWAYRSHATPKFYGKIHNIIKPDGYEWHLPRRLSEATIQLVDLKKRNWLDHYTRVLTHEFVLLNTNDLQYAYVNILLEITETGYIQESFDIRYFYPNYFLKNLDYFSITCFVFLSMLTVFMAIHLLRLVHRKNISELVGFWMLHKATMFLTSTICILLQLGQFFILSDFRDDLSNGNIPYGSDVYDIALLDDVITYLFGFLAFLVIIRVLRLFSYTHIYHYTSEVLTHAFQPMAFFIGYHLLVVLGFSALNMLIFQQHVFEYRNFWQSFLSVLFYQWCRKEVSSTVHALHKWGICLGILLMLYLLVIARNMMRAILLNAANNNNGSEVAKRLSDEGLFMYVWKRIRRNNKKKRHVHFNDANWNPSEYQIIENDEAKIPIDAETARQNAELNKKMMLQRFQDLPPLPYPTFDLDSNLITILASLDQMLVNEDFEVEMFEQMNRNVQLEKSKTFYSIEKIPNTSSKC